MSSMMHPLFTIITVTYNAADTLQRTLQSIDSQSCQLYEHIIMDGASTDGTVSLANEYANERRTVISKPDKGIYDAMNRAMGYATGDYLIFLNSGDKFHAANTLQKIADAILDNDYPGVVYGQTDVVDNDGNYLGPRHLKAPADLTLNSFKDGMVVCHQAFVVYRKLAAYYNLKYRYSADYEWCINCLQKSKRNVYIPTTLIDYLSEGLTTRNHRKSLKERFDIMCTYYGTLPTVWNHAKFIFRYLGRRNKSANKQ